MKALIFALGMILGMFLTAGSAHAYPVSTHWNFNLNGVDVEAYDCNDDSCASVTGPFFVTNTGSASSIDISYDVPRSCGSAPFYTAYYFFKPCYLPQQWYVFSTCDFSASNDVSFYKINDGKARILSLDAPPAAQAGQAVQISADIDSVQTSGVIKPKYIPPARKANYYSTDVAVTLTVKSGSTAVYTDTRSLNIYQDATQPVAFSWTPSAAGTYTIEVSTDVTDCKCSSTVKQTSARTITVQSPPPANSCSDTDGGNVITILGSTSGYLNGNPYSHSDYCVDSGSINEYYCSGALEASQQQSCGTDGYVGSNYCLSGDVYRDFRDYTCSSGACSSSTAPKLQQDCQYGCSNGVCNPAPQNTPPVISGLPDRTIYAGQSIGPVDLWAYASDSQDADSLLSFSIDYETNTGVIDCSISGNRYLQCGAAMNAGYSDVTVKVRDTGGLSDTDEFRITVQSQPPPVNTPPAIDGIPDQSVKVGEAISLIDLWAYASDGQDPDSSLSFSLDSESNTGAVDCYVTGNRYVGCGAGQTAGYSDITVRVTDTGGLYDTDSFRITVTTAPQPQEQAPVITSIHISPSSPKDSDDMSCTVFSTDQNGNLDSAEFKWFVDGALQKTRVVYLSGSSASAQDTLPSSFSGIGDVVKCQVTVRDTAGNQDTASDEVTVQVADCSVDVYGLSVSGNLISFWVKNRGQTQQQVTYSIFVDTQLVAEASVSLFANEETLVQKSYSFGFGDFPVKARAVSACGASDSETIIHTVASPAGDDRPSIDFIRITPADPEEFDDLTCRVEMSDNNGDLDRLQIRWFVEGDLERTRTFDVSGSSDSVEDTLSSGFRDGEEVRCAAKVTDRRDNEDSDSDSVTIGDENGDGCGVDVYSLEFIDNNEIRFRIRNTGQDTENINYRVYVEGELIIEHNIVLDEDEWESIEETFSFDVSDSLIKVRARAECGATDTEFLSDGGHGRCTAGYLNEYRCAGSWVQRKYQNSDCSTIWVNSEYCSQGCSNGLCIGAGGQCGVSIQRFEYQNNVVAGNAAFVTLEARNTGARQATITLSLWVDGQLKESHPATINSGAVALRTFYHYPAAGTHQIQAKAESSCGSSDIRTASISVISTGPGPQPYPQPQPQPAPSLPTAVSIYPSSLDTSLCAAKFVTIDIRNSVRQVYTIQVTGVPSEWVSYQSQNVVEQGDRQLFVYVGPKEMGAHSIIVKVRAEGESREFQQNVAVYTAAACAPSQPPGWDVTGLLVDAAKSPWFWLVLLIAIVTIVVLAGTAMLRPDEEFYEPDYPCRAKKG